MVASVDGFANLYGWNPTAGGEGSLLVRNWLTEFWAGVDRHAGRLGNSATEQAAAAATASGPDGKEVVAQTLPADETELPCEAESLQQGFDLGSHADGKPLVPSDSKTFAGRVKRHHRPAQGRGRVR